MVKFKNFIALYLFLFSILFLSFRSSTINHQYFDEIHYIPAALEWLEMSPTRNIEHPPLGKYIFALSIKTFGNNPVGWRASSIIFGSLALTFIYLIAIEFFEDKKIAISVYFFSLFNQWIFIQSRVKKRNQRR